MNVIIYGTGKFAEYAWYALTNDSDYNVTGFCMEKKYIGDLTNIKGLPVTEFETIEKDFPPDDYQLFIAVGLNKIREKLFKTAKIKGYKMITYISSKATTWDDLQCGENTWVGEGSGIQPFVTIGNNTILFGTDVGHHAKIGSHVLLSVATIGGNVTIKDYSFMGLNSTVKPNMVIGNNNIIGMGSIITKDTKDNEIYQAAKTTVKRNISTDKFDKRYL